MPSERVTIIYYSLLLLTMAGLAIVAMCTPKPPPPVIASPPPVIAPPRILTRAEKAVAMIIDSCEKDATSLASFRTVGGNKAVVRALRKHINFLKLKAQGGQGMGPITPSFILLHGPPGTGKSLMAGAFALAMGARLLVPDTSTFFGPWMGESEAQTSAVFAAARAIAPCVIFLDEIDAICAPRAISHNEHRGSVTAVIQLGLTTPYHDPSKFIIIIAATNYMERIEPAVLSRMTSKFFVPLPDRQDRLDILAKLLAGNPLAADGATLLRMAEATKGFGGRELNNACRSAAAAIQDEDEEAAAAPEGGGAAAAPAPRGEFASAGFSADDFISAAQVMRTSSPQAL